jgi:regulation of enolase protein 1 (concanavalin A-like superfamily)
MRGAMRAGLFVLTILGFLTLGTTSFHAEQNGFTHSVKFAELTYGQAITATAADPNHGGFWFGGYTCSTKLPTTGDAPQKTWTATSCTKNGLPYTAGIVGHMSDVGSVDFLTYWGGSGNSRVTAISIEPGGAMVIAGVTQSTDFVTTPNAYSRTCAGGCAQPDGFVTWMGTEGGSIEYSSYFGGSGQDYIASVALDGNLRIHIAGWTESADLPTTSGAILHTFTPGPLPGYTDAFYARLDARSNALQYSTYLGGRNFDTATGVAVDGNGNAYVAGNTSSNDFSTFDAAQPQPAGNPGYVFLAKFASSGPVYSTYVGGAGPADVSSVAVAGDQVYLAGSVSSPTFGGGSDTEVNTGSAYIAEASADSATIGRTIALRGVSFSQSAGTSLAVDANHVAYLAGTFTWDDCEPRCGPETFRYPTTADAYQRTMKNEEPQQDGDALDAVLSIVDFRPAAPSILYSTMIGGGNPDEGFAVATDGSGGAFVAGVTASVKDFPSLNAMAQPPPDPTSNQSFAAYITPIPAPDTTPPADIVLYTSNPSAITGDWQIASDATAAGGFAAHEPDEGAAKVATPAEHPVNYFEMSFQAQADVPYHLWLRMKAAENSFQNDSVWVQFSDSIDGGGNPVWRIHSTDATGVVLEDCSGCGEQGWGWNDNGYGVAGTPVIFAASGWHTIRIQQREDGVSIDQILLSSSQWLNTAPGANKNDTTVLPQTTEGATDQPPTVSITNPSNGATFEAPHNLTVTASASDPDGTIARVTFYEDGAFISSTSTAPYSLNFGTVNAGTYTFTAVATDNDGATTTSSPVTITVTGAKAGAPPPGWNDQDIGGTGAQGSVEYGNGLFTIKGAGADVWGTSDAFHYVYLPLSGDGSITAWVISVSDEANWVKAGVMIRGSLSPSSAQAFMLVSHAKGVAFQRRTADGSASVSSAGSASTAPRWVRLVRAGSTISGYESADGRNWTLVGSDTFSMSSTAFVGLAVSSHVPGTVATAEFGSVSTPLPAGWTDSDIGNVPFPGAASYGATTFNVTGSGADVWGASDAFNYAYRALSGNGTIVARVARLQDVDPWVKAGVMIRETLAPDSRHAFMLVSASKGVAFQRREATGGSSVNTAGSSSPLLPYWIKLTRSADTFAAYESADGTNWTLVGTDTIAMAANVYIGLAVTSHNTSSSATAAFDNVSIQ